MTSTTSLQVAVIVDLYPPPDIHTNVQHNDQLWATVSKLRLNDLSSYDVVRLYVLTSSPDDANTSLEQAGVSGEDVEVKVLATDDRIRAFYEAKQALDTEEISDIRLVCLDLQRQFWAEVGGFDYTNFHIIRTEHGKRVWVVGEEQPVKFDGLVTNKRDVTIAAAGADCIPLLFADPVAMVIGAAHAGWRGTVEGVAGRVVQTMTKEFGSDPKDVRVAMGPCVLPGCFGVLPDETKCFADIDPSCPAKAQHNALLCHPEHRVVFGKTG
nr:hypothetical protein BaRGS_004084 [Batillaria attramentaria]